MSEHSLHSSYREKLIEHLLVGELLKFSWRNKDFSLEIAKPEVDNSGYDIIAESNGVIRHIQLKAAFVRSATASQKSILPWQKPSGCVVLVYFDNETLGLRLYYFYGAAPEFPLPSLDHLRIAKHTKGYAMRLKADRPNIRILNKGQFDRLLNVKELLIGCSEACLESKFFKAMMLLNFAF